MMLDPSSVSQCQSDTCGNILYIPPHYPPVLQKFKSRHCLPKSSLCTFALGVKSCSKVMITYVPAALGFCGGEMRAEVYEKENV